MNVQEKVNNYLGSAAGFTMLAFYVLFPIGELYWIWMSIKLGSFAMFVVGIIPPFFIIAAPIGAWSLVFGLPEWVVSMFG